MLQEQIGNAVLYLPKNGGNISCPGADTNTAANADADADIDIHSDGSTKQLQEIVEQCQEADYHSQITARRDWTVMYQLAESRGNVIEWLELPRHAKTLELGAGCGSVTSVLLQKGARVTCQEENVHYSRLNAKRHQAAEGLAIYAMPFDLCEPRLDNDYDVVVLIGVLAMAKADELLQKLRGHLKPQGMLVIAAENKFGLKYWAGNKEEHTHAYFAGLENTAARQGVRTFTRRGLEELLAETGYRARQFYYPYPDYRFALDIFSDRYLPKKGDLTYNIANYEDDRIVLFDEQKVFDSIIEEGQFPLFSNSYLCIAQTAGEAAKPLQPQETIYTRYASDRSREHAVRTDMVCVQNKLHEYDEDAAVPQNPMETGKAVPQNAMETVKKVRKLAVYPEGNAHVLHIAEAYEKLCSQYQDTGIRFNRCRIAGGAGKAVLEFEFIQGEALQAQVEQAIAAHDMKKVFDILRRMVQYIRNGKRKQPFVLTEEFTRVFGGIPGKAVLALEGAECGAVSDIDLILSNIIVDKQGTWHVIDYEWTFFFPIPLNFIIYRTLFFLNHENEGHEELSMERLLKSVGITKQEAAVYAQMEEGFQQFTAGALVPYREMVNLMERRFFNVVQLKADYDRVVFQNELLKGRGIWKIAKKIKDKLVK